MLGADAPRNESKDAGLGSAQTGRPQYFPPQILLGANQLQPNRGTSRGTEILVPNWLMKALRLGAGRDRIWTGEKSEPLTEFLRTVM